MVSDVGVESKVSVEDLFRGVRWKLVKEDPEKKILGGYTTKVKRDDWSLIKAIEASDGAVNFVEGEEMGTAWMPECMGLKDKSKKWGLDFTDL